MKWLLTLDIIAPCDSTEERRSAYNCRGVQLRSKLMTIKSAQIIPSAGLVGSMGKEALELLERSFY
jgi:hypothetical protein